MLVHNDAGIEFGGLTLDRLRVEEPALFTALQGKNSADAFAGSMTGDADSMACLFNIWEAIKRLPAGLNQAGDSMGRFIREINLQGGIHRDRFKASASRELFVTVKAQSDSGRDPKIEPANPGLHPGAKLSFKEARFPEANLQFTFHFEKDTDDPMVVEMDMDYFKDQAAHFLLEVIPNEAGSKLLHLKNATTDPRKIYAMRWMSGMNSAGRELFEPVFVMENA